MLPFPQKISFEQKYTHHVVDVHDVRSLKQFLPCKKNGVYHNNFAIFLLFVLGKTKSQTGGMLNLSAMHKALWCFTKSINSTGDYFPS